MPDILSCCYGKNEVPVKYLFILFTVATMWVGLANVAGFDPVPQISIQLVRVAP